MKTKAVIHARVSTAEQGQGYSLPTQLESCREYATQQGYSVLAEFTDMHTGTEIDRPGLNELYEFVEKNPVDVFIVHDLDRLSREVGNQAIIEMEMSTAGVEIEYVLGQYAKTPEGELTKNIKAVIAQYENRQRVERSRRGKRGRVEAGYVIVPAGRAPFGYSYVSEKRKGWLAINEEQAQVIRQMYKWLVEDGLSSYEIARRLFENGVLSKGDMSPIVIKKEGPASWSPTTVRRMVTNSVYKGTWYYGKTRLSKVNGRTVQRSVPETEWIAVRVPAIVDEKTWALAQGCVDKNKQMSRRNTTRQYLLRGMVYCPCGRKRVGCYKNHLKRAYYRCPATESEYWRNRCEHRYSHNQEILEDAVWKKVHEFILEPDNLVAEVEQQRTHATESVERKTKRLEAIESAISEVDRQLGILLDQVLTSGFSQAILDQKQHQLLQKRSDLEATAVQVTAELSEVTITPDQEAELIRFVQEMRGTLGDLSFKNKRRILELIRLRVDVISRTQVRISGIISSEGLFVDLSSA
jgi:site-specific DNA recombinase